MEATLAGSSQLSLEAMPAEVIAALLSWLPPSAVGACLAASRLFWVLGEAAMDRQALARAVDSAGGVCPCATRARDRLNKEVLRPHALCLVRGAQTAHATARLHGPSLDGAHACLPAAVTAAATSGRLDLVRALYARATLLWYGDGRCACCVDFTPRDAPTRRCHPWCANCAAFLDWIFCRQAASDTQPDGLPLAAALAAGHPRVAMWIAAAGGLHHRDRQDVVDVVLARAHFPLPSDCSDATAAPKKNDAARNRSSGDADERLLTALWCVWPKAARAAMCRALRCGDADAWQMVARMWHRSREGRRWLVTDSTLVVGAAAASARPYDALSWVWREFTDMFLDRPVACRRMAIAAALAGRMDVAAEAARAYGDYAKDAVPERHMAHSTAAVPDIHAPVSAGETFGAVDDLSGDHNGRRGALVGGDRGAVGLDDGHETISCDVVSAAVRSGRADAIDAAVALWRLCRMCRARKGLGCGSFDWHNDKSLRAPGLGAGLVHVIAHYPRIWPTAHALDAVVGASRVDLLDRIDMPACLEPARLAQWVRDMGRDGCADALVRVLARCHIRADPFGSVDLTSALVAATDAARLDVVLALWPHISDRHKTRAADAIADAAAESNRADILAWLADGATPSPAQGLWVVAAERGDLHLLKVLTARAEWWPVSCASIAIAHGHVACAALLLDLPPLRTDADRDTSQMHDARPRLASTRAYKRRRTDDAAAAARRPTLPPSYAVDALARGHVDALDWAAAGPFSIPWADVSIAAALDRAQDIACFDAAVRWTTQSPWARASPRLATDLSTWAAATLASGDPVRIGRLLARCPWQAWGVTSSAAASGMCICPLGAWRALDARRIVDFDAPCFAHAAAASGRVDVLVWMANERRPAACWTGGSPLFTVAHAETAYRGGHMGATAWILGRLDAAAVGDFAARNRQSLKLACAQVIRPLLPHL
ncbi:hypothetical protein [Pandoravirus japonicus]|uniref:Ankyrin repeat domain containing protein n=1 Tax=Pandoravirus japonicus TaxID=2823154 RepID=A0A811BMF3_9VIRU|nr:hypothetical protein [Pandoravirus japonicus]